MAHRCNVEEELVESDVVLDPSFEPSDGLLERRHIFTSGATLHTYLKSSIFRATLINLGLILTWYVLGTSLSLWNKLLVGKDHGLFGKGAFPAPFLMSSLQFFCQHLLARLMIFAGWVSPRQDASVTWKEYFVKVVPNGVATGLDIGFSNYSLVFITLSFYVMCKSTTPIFLLAFSFAWGIEQPSWSLAGIVLVIVSGLLLLVAGETQFDVRGFILVMTAAMMAGLRWTITQVLLQGDKNGHGGKHDGGRTPVEVIHQLTPIMGITLLVLSLGHERLWNTLPVSPYFETFGHTMLTGLIMLVGGMIAFAMVWAEFALIANTSALTFMVAGTFKEIVTVGAAVLFLHEPFTLVNALGLVVLIAGVVLFNLHKMKMLKKGEITPFLVSGVSGTIHPHTEETEEPLVNNTQYQKGHGSSPTSDTVVEMTSHVNTKPIFTLIEGEEQEDMSPRQRQRQLQSKGVHPVE